MFIKKYLISIAAFGFFILSIFLYLLDVFRGPWNHDEGYYLVQSLAISQGLKPIIDYPTLYPPLFNILNAIPLLLKIDHWILAWSLPLFWVVMNGLLTTFCWKKYTGSRWEVCLFVGALFPIFCILFEGNHITLELGVTFFALLGLLHFDAEKSYTFFGVGILVGCAFLVKQMGILLLLPFVTQVRTLKQIVYLFFGVGISIFLCVWWFHFDFEKMGSNFQWLSQYVHRASPNGILFSLKVFFIKTLITEEDKLFVLSLSLLVLLCSVINILQAIKTKKWRYCFWIMSWLIVGIVYFGARAINDYPHYTLNCWAVIIVLLASGDAFFRLKLICAFVLFYLLILLNLYHAQFFYYIVGKSLNRWSAPNALVAFFKPMAAELKVLLPNHVTVTQLGFEEFIIFFLADHLPMNIGLLSYKINFPVEGDVILLTNYHHLEQTKNTINQAGYLMVKSWKSFDMEVVLYKKPTILLSPV